MDLESRLQEAELEIHRLTKHTESLESDLSGLRKDFEKLRDEFSSVRLQVTGEDEHGMIEDRPEPEDPLTKADVERIAEKIFDRKHDGDDLNRNDVYLIAEEVAERVCANKCE